MSPDTSIYSENSSLPNEFFDIIKSNGLDLPEISSDIHNQILSYLNTINSLKRTTFERKSPVEKARDFAMLYFIMAHFISSRDKRIDELESKEVAETIKIKESLFL